MKISVVSPTYNHARFLRQNLDCILSQTHRDIEVIIVNDGSTDETHDILTEYAEKDSRVNYQRLEQNRGMMEAFEHGYKLATGDLIYPTASDDYLCAPTFFDDTVQLIRQIPDAAGVFGRCQLVDSETGRELGVMGGFSELSGYIPPRQCMEAFLNHRGVIPGVSCIMRRDLVNKIGGYPKDLGPQNDYFVNHALAGMAGVVFLGSVVAVHRMNAASYNATISFEQRIRNYSLVEKRMRALGAYDGFDANLISIWRKAVIEGAMSGTAQRHLFQVLRHVVETGPNVLFWMHLPQAHREFFKSIIVDSNRLEKRLDVLQTWALEEFRRIVGC